MPPWSRSSCGRLAARTGMVSIDGPVNSESLLEPVLGGTGEVRLRYRRLTLRLLLRLVSTGVSGLPIHSSARCKCLLGGAAVNIRFDRRRREASGRSATACQSG